MSLRQRAPTAIILLAVLLVLIQWAPAWAFFAAIQAAMIAALWEFYNLARRRRWRPLRGVGLAMALLISASFFEPRFPLAAALFLGIFLAAASFVAAFNTLEKIAVFPPAFALTVGGALFIALPMGFLHWIRLEGGPPQLYFLFTVVFLGDSGAFLFGHLFGRHKMTPLASPNKTWEGGAGGLLFAALGALAVRALFLPQVPLLRALLCGVLVHAAAQLSDPLESLFKRAAGVKDSSNLLPGHGGFLDRLDSLLLAAPFFYYFVLLFWK